MVLKYKLCFILQKSLQIYESIIFDISLSETKFLVLKLFDLKRRKIFKIFNAKDEVRLTPYEDDKLKRLEFNKFKAYCVQVLLHYGKYNLGCIIYGGEIMTERVKELIAEQLGLQPEDIRPECSLTDDLGADSLDLVELLMAFSDEFDIEIDDDQAENIVTVSDILDALRENE